MNQPSPGDTKPAERRAAEHRLREWFATQGWRPLPFQREVWRRYRLGESGLIHTPTGSGKTLAALGGPLIEALAASSAATTNTGRRKPPARGPTVLWVTPLRALANDTARALREPIEALRVNWQVGLRTGDASARDRRLARAGRLDVLIITPESLALLLSYADTAQLLGALRCVVVDEWHELLDSKRGVLLQLCLARLRVLTPELRLWGLSATLGNLDEARDTLLPWAPRSAVVSSAARRAVTIQTLLPADNERFPWAGHLGLVQLPRVLDALAAAGTSLLFTHTRAQAELWHRALQSVWPHAPDTLALHHGSLDAALRKQVELGLRDGSLRCVVATSSLDLGVDFPAVDQVLQVGSAKGVGRLLQRAGRARHRPGEAGHLVCVPTHALELVEYAAAREALGAGRIESRRPPQGCLDVLAQHCITLALGGGFDADALLTEVRGTHAYAALGADDWQATLDFIVRGGSALESYPEFCRVQRDDDGRYRVHDRRAALRQRLSIGTISSDGSVSVKLMRGGALGSVEESFVGKLRPGDRLHFAGRLLELVKLQDMTAYVRLARSGKAAVATWQGGRLALSATLGREVGELLSRPSPATSDHPELRAVAPLLQLQARLSRLPQADELLVEWLHSREGWHLCLYPFAGRTLHEGLAALIALRWGRLSPNTFSLTANDYGLMLSAQAEVEIDASQVQALLTPQHFERDLRESVNLGELVRRQFREVARVAGLLPPSLPGRAVRSQRQLQASSGLLFDVLSRFDPGHMLLRQAEREVLDQQLQSDALARLLFDLQSRTIALQQPASLTPLAFPLWADSLRGMLSTEDWRTRMQRAAAQLERRHRSRASRAA